MAINQGNTEVVLALLDKGANIEAADQVLCVRPLDGRECGRVCMCLRARVCMRVYARAFVRVWCKVALHCVLVLRAVTHVLPLYGPPMTPLWTLYDPYGPLLPSFSSPHMTPLCPPLCPYDSPMARMVPLWPS